MSNNAMLGGEIETMRALKGKLNEQSTTVATLTSTLDSQVSSTVWTGPAADRFRDMWNSQFKTTLNQLRQALDDAAREVDNRAQAIEVATA
jgi:WXG100 family type VII secretion target